MSLNAERSFKDYLQKKEKTDPQQAKKTELFVMQTMKDEGFTEKQIYSMPIKRLESLIFDSSSNTVTNIISDMALQIEKNPGMAKKATPILEEFARKLEKMYQE